MAFQLIDQAKLNQDFRGHAEKAVYTFNVLGPDQLGSSWTARQMLEGHINELQAQGSLLLEYKLWEDKQSGTFTTEYRVEMIASASPLWWNIIIIGVLAVLSILFISWTLQNVEDIAEYGGGGLVLGLSAIGLGLLGLGIYAVVKRRGGNA